MTYFRFRYPNHSLVPLSAKQKSILHAMQRDIQSKEMKFVPTFCPCESGSEVTLSEVDCLGVYLRYVICKRCGIIRANPYMDAESLKIFYEKYYETLYHYGPDTNPLARDLDDEFEESVKYAKTHTLPFVNLDKGKNILMIGGRCGGRLYPFLENGNKCTVVDFDIASIEYAKKQGLAAFSGDYKEIKFDCLFDLIICDHSLEHFLDIKAELTNLSKLLDIKGRLLLSVPDGSKLHTLHNFADSRMEFRLCHNYLFSKRSFTNLLKKFGFSLIKSSYIAHPMNLVCVFEKNGNIESTGNKNTLRDRGAYKDQIKSFIKAELLFGLYQLIQFRRLKEKFGPRLKNNPIIFKLYRALFFKKVNMSPPS